MAELRQLGHDDDPRSQAARTGRSRAGRGCQNQPADIAGWNAARGAAVRMGGGALVARDMDITIERAARFQILAAAAACGGRISCSDACGVVTGAVSDADADRPPPRTRSGQRHLSTWRYIDPDNPDGEASGPSASPPDGQQVHWLYTACTASLTGSSATTATTGGRS